MVSTIFNLKRNFTFQLLTLMLFFCLFSFPAFAEFSEEKINLNYQFNSFMNSSVASNAQVDLNIQSISSSFWTSICDIIVEGDTAYCAIGNGLAIYDISDPANPNRLSLTYLQDVGGINLLKVGDYIYLTLGRGGLSILDVSNIYNPTVVGSCNTPDYALSIFIKDSLAYIADRDSGMQIINIANPTNPSIIGSYDTDGEVLNVFVTDTLAYLADNYGKLTVVKIKHPSTPSFFKLYTDFNNVQDLFIVDTIAYVVDGYLGLKTLNITDPKNPIYLDNFNAGNNFYDITIRDTLAYIANSWDGLLIVNISDPLDLKSVFRDTTKLNRSTEQVFLRDSLAFLANNVSGFEIVNIQNPIVAHEIGGLATPGYCHEIEVIDTIAYIITNSQTVEPISFFQTVNITDPYNPVILDQIQLADDSYDIKIQDTLAFINISGDSFVFVNIANPLDLQIVTTMTFGPFGALYNDFFLEDTLLYAGGSALGSAQVWITNIADIYNPLDVSSIDIPNGYVIQVQVIDTIAFLGYMMSSDSISRGIRIVNVADPFNPVIISSLFTPRNPYAIAIQDTIMFVANIDYGLVLINIADIENPTIIDNFDTPGLVYDVQIFNNLVYVSDNYAGILVIDYSDILNPVVVGSYNTPGNVNDFVFDDSMIYIADYYSLLFLEAIQYQCFSDNDFDMFGDPSLASNNYSLGDCISGFASNNYDCDDSDPTVYLGAPEIDDDGIDQNCDGVDATCCISPIRGNVDGDLSEAIDISDLVRLVGVMFQFGEPFPCIAEADFNGSGGITPVDITDLVTLVDYMFQSGPPPADCP